MVLFFACSAFAAAPFGVEMGALISTLADVKPVAGAGDLYRFRPSTPHPEFESYAVLAPADLGVVRVVGFGHGYPGDLSGASVRLSAESLVVDLTARYGTPQKYDFLHAGSIWDDVGDWTMGLFQHQRTLVWAWTPHDTTIESVMLEAVAYTSATPALNLTYEFTNAKGYFDRKKKAADGAL